jgi:NAD(P)-dependent dehydrogenase (short-subunit alcohol dehydrogenase family)
MKDKICLITGGTSGIGKETALALAKMGAILVLPSRNPEKGEQVKQEIISKSGNQQVEVMECDLASFASIRSFAKDFIRKYSQLHVLLNNAGVWKTERKESKDGIELTFATNHLAPFLLTNLLLDVLMQSAPSRIINVSSGAHYAGRLNFEDLELKKSYNHIKAYNQSKVANVLFTRELASRLAGTGVTVNALEPGLVDTPLFENMGKVAQWIVGLIAKSPAKGAETNIYLASSPELEGVTGQYFKNKRRKRPAPQARNDESASRLWRVSEQYVGVGESAYVVNEGGENNQNLKL